MTRQGTGTGARAKGEGGAGRDARSGGTAPGGTSTEEDHFHCFELQTSKSMGELVGIPLQQHVVGLRIPVRVPTRAALLAVHALAAW